MTQKIKDALWPFIPENQPRELNSRNPEGHRRSSAFSPNEMYGPLWIMLTLIVEIIVMSHLTKTLRAQIGYGIGSGQDVLDSVLVE